MKIQKYLAALIIIILSGFCAPTLEAAPVWGKEFQFRQPDGSLVPVKVWGDEFYQRVESPDGYTLVRNADGWICYADLSVNEDELLATDAVYCGQQRQEAVVASSASSMQPKTLKKGLKLKPSARRQKHKAARDARNFDQFAADGAAMAAGETGDSTVFAPPLATQPLTGSVTGLVICINFPDEAGTMAVQQIDNYCNQVGYNEFNNNGSVHDYYYDVSGGKLTYTNVVTGYYTAKNNKSYYDDPMRDAGFVGRELVGEALDWLESEGFDFSQVSVDQNNRMLAVNVFYAGEVTAGWSTGLWPHSWSYYGFTSASGVRSGPYQITNMGTSLGLATFCHENGHMICNWPDLYDYDYDSRGVGGYCLMAFSGPDNNPVPPNAYFRDIKGWENVIEITPDNGPEYIHQANTASSYRFSNPVNPAEFFYIESRIRDGRNLGLPDVGFMVWHVDEFGSNDWQDMIASSHYLVSLEQADGRFDLENNINYGDSGDLYSLDSVFIWDNDTIPNTRWWNGTPTEMKFTVLSDGEAENMFAIELGDSTPPTPLVPTWEIKPTATGPHHIVMKCTTATDISGVEYYFDCIENGSYDSGWQDSRLYEVIVGEGQGYTFRVITRDKSTNQNATEWSESVHTTTCVGTDTLAPAPGPISGWGSKPRQYTIRRDEKTIYMQAAQCYDESGVTYEFNCVATTDPDATLSSFKKVQSSRDYMVDKTLLHTGKRYTFTVTIRDGAGNALQTSAPAAVGFGTVASKVLRVPLVYPTIKAAVGDAIDGDIIELQSNRTYVGPDNRNVDFGGLAITIRSENPQDPNVVKATIIDCEGTVSGGDSSEKNRRAFVFQNGEGPDSIVSGLTIINAFAFNNPADSEAGTIGEDAKGGAILCEDGASPSIINCIIRNSYAQGQSGGKGGVDGDPGAPGAPGTETNPDGGVGGDGLPGTGEGAKGGAGLGGAIYCGLNSSPVISGCLFENTYALGGTGGQGGQGGAGGKGGDAWVDPVDPNAVSGNGGQGGKGGDGAATGAGGIGRGGAIYFEGNNSPTIEKCQMISCFAINGGGGSAGNGGAGGAGGLGSGPDGKVGPDGEPGENGDNVSGEGAVGGAIYVGSSSSVNMTETEFQGCRATDDGGVIYMAHQSSLTAADLQVIDCGASAINDPNFVCSAVWLDYENTATFAQSVFSGNVAAHSTVWSGRNSTLTFSECQFEDNQSQDSGAAISVRDGSVLNVVSSVFLNNISQGQGGAINSVDCEELDIDSSVFEGNLSADSGGAILAYDITLFTVDDSQFISNKADGAGDGGAICWICETKPAAAFDSTGNLFEGNTAGIGSDPVVSDGFDAYGDGGAISIMPTWEYTFDGSPYVNIKQCEFVENNSDTGGAVSVRYTGVTIDECVFTNNMSEYGGAVFWNWADVTVRNSSFAGNMAENTDGQNLSCSGGALYGLDASFRIYNCKFAENAAILEGGAMRFAGWFKEIPNGTQDVVNCLMTKNTAIGGGGAFSAVDGAMPFLINCTMVGNTVTGAGGFGGAIGCQYSGQSAEGTYVLAENCILWDNMAEFGTQAAVGDPLNLYNRFSMLELSYSNIQGGADEVYVGQPEGTCTVYDAGGVINANPLFTEVNDPASEIERTYYLQQKNSGGVLNSPCYNSGIGSISALSALLQFDATTRTDHTPDGSTMDMGFHYDASVPVKYYTVTIEVFKQDYYAHGTIKSPWAPGVYTNILQGSTLKLEAVPDAGYRVADWSGTTNDRSYATVNTVMVNKDCTAQVEFELDAPRSLYVPESYDTIEEAILAAREKDTIVLAPNQIYLIDDPDGINFEGKQLVIRSGDPNDPAIVASTVIDCRGSRYTSKRAFHFASGERSDSKIEGITIRNAFTAEIGLSMVLDTGRWPWPFENPPDPLPPYRALSGMDGTGDSYGGAILCENGSSPTIRNCVFENCTVSGGIGGDGEDGLYGPDLDTDQDLDSQSGGHSGKGTGNGYGGAIAIRSASSPQIINCTFKRNRATGGWGGIPGDAGRSYNAGRYGWGGNDPAGIAWAMQYGVNLEAGYGEGDGHGGAIYVEAKCAPQIVGCTFEGNYARMGYISPGGAEWGGNDYPEPWDNDPWGEQGAREGRDGQLFAYDTTAGGALFLQEGADVVVEGCSFTENEAYNHHTSYEYEYNYSSSTRGGAIYCDPNAVLSIQPIDVKWKFTADMASNTLTVGTKVSYHTGIPVRLSTDGTLPAPLSTKKVYSLIVLNDYQVMLANNGADALAGRCVDITGEGTGTHCLSYVIWNTFTGNMAGALYSSTDGTLTINKSRFINNVSTPPDQSSDNVVGGAITIEADANAVALITDTEFYGNVSSYEGGAVWTASSVQFTDCVLNGNRSAGHGGAIYAYADVPSPETHTIMVGVDTSELSGNEAQGFGGAMFGRNTDTIMKDVFMVKNTAFSGGALRLSYSQLDMDECLVLQNVATGVVTGRHRSVVAEGYGGGLHLADTAFVITNTRFEDNAAQGVISLGGALCVTGKQSYYSQELFNCLLVQNESDYMGGAVACREDADVRLENCTLADNASAPKAKGNPWNREKTYLSNEFVVCSDGVRYKSKIGNMGQDPTADVLEKYWEKAAGGAVYVDHLSKVCLERSIVSDNNGIAIYEKPGASDSNIQSTAVYTLFCQNSGGDVFDGGKRKVFESAADVPNYSASTLLIECAEFARGDLGNYYLRQSNSPAVDPAFGGSYPTAAALGLDTYTTSVNNMMDVGKVDLGFHYIPYDRLVKYTLTASFVDDEGTMRTDAGEVQMDSLRAPMIVKTEVPRGAIKTLNAYLKDEFFLTAWSGGTFNDNSQEAENYVLMTRDKDINILVRARQTLYLGGSGEYDTLGDAIDAAQDGDIILVAPGQYTAASQYPQPAANNVWLKGKKITISGFAPADEAVTRSTVFRDFRFLFSDLDKSTVVEGVSFTQSHMVMLRSDATIRNCVFFECRFNESTDSHEGTVPPGTDGYHGFTCLGGAISMFDSKPEIINCIFEDNWARGSNGENGFNGGREHPTGGDGGWPGGAYGGAVYCGLSSAPTFRSCTFTGNQVFGGNGGNGANGWVDNGTIHNGGRGGGWVYDPTTEEYLKTVEVSGWDGWTNNSYGDKYGARSMYYMIYMGWFDEVVWGQWDIEQWAKWFSWGDNFTSWDQFLTAFGNSSYDPLGDPYDQKLESWRYSGFGGAVYGEFDCRLAFEDCVFENNASNGGLTGVGGVQPDARTPWPDRQLNMPTAGGAVYGAWDSELSFTRCLFRNNLASTSTVDLPHTFNVSFGGAVAYENDCKAIFRDCDIWANEATVGGGIYGRYATSEIADCNVFGNEAYMGAGIYLERDEAEIKNTVFQANTARTLDPVVEPVDPDEPEEPQDPEEPVVPPATVDLEGMGGGLFAHLLKLSICDSVFVGNAAEISGGGLQLSGTVEQDSDVFNTLFANNNADRDGGGASINWLSRVNFDNCTFADNSASDPSGLFDSYGGGLFVGTKSKVCVSNSIFWDNEAEEGRQVSIGTASEFDDPAELSVSHTEVGGYPNLHSIYQGTGAVLNVGDDVFTADPKFVSPTDVDPTDQIRKYFLDQELSPCVDRGAMLAVTAGLDGYTTSIVGKRDKGTVDLGYHYQFARQTDCAKIDEALILSGKIDLADMAVFLEEWLNLGCTDPEWCNGADLNFDGAVNFDDMAAVTFCWDAEDTEAPNQGKIAWAVQPQIDYEATSFALKMAATPVQDNWWPYTYFADGDPIERYGVLYSFDCIEPASGYDSGWQAEPTFKIPNDVQKTLPLNMYTYSLTAKDGRNNLTDPIATVTVRPELPAAVWERVPHVNDENYVEMEVAPLTAQIGSGTFWGYAFKINGVEYGKKSESTTYVHPQSFAEGEIIRIQAMVGLYKSGLEAGDELIASSWTPEFELRFERGDIYAPVPNPAQHTVTSPFQTQINGVFPWYHVVTAEVATDIDAFGELGEENVNVEYMFVCEDDSQYSSGWRRESDVAGLLYPNGTQQHAWQYWVAVGGEKALNWHIIVRDTSPRRNQTAASETKRVKLE